MDRVSLYSLKPKQSILIQKYPIVETVLDGDEVSNKKKPRNNFDLKDILAKFLVDWMYYFLFISCVCDFSLAYWRGVRFAVDLSFT